jgi:hypothetical protein
LLLILGVETTSGRAEWIGEPNLSDNPPNYHWQKLWK